MRAQNFVPRLKAHLLARHLKMPYLGEEVTFTDAQLDDVIIQYGRILEHATASFHYTTYDIRREQDNINSRSQRRYIMVPSFEEPDPDDIDSDARVHPYWYARVLGIYHVKVYLPGNGNRPEKMSFMWVRWFGRDLETPGGPSTLRLDKIGYVYGEDPEAFGFIDPAIVLRACHLIPAFADGMTRDLLRPSRARDDANNGDWAHYYVMRSVFSPS